MKKNPQAILFDWDNTLVDTWPVIHEALTYSFVQMGKNPWDLAETKKKVHRSMRDAFPEIFGDEWEKAADLYQSYFRKIHLDRIKSLEFSEQMLENLRKNNDLWIGVVSNKKGDNLRKEVNHLKWEKYFDVVVGAQDALLDKPFKEPILHALINSNILPSEQVILVGDSVTDLECAENSAISSILYSSERDEVEKENSRYLREKFSPIYEVFSHQQLDELFCKIIER
jgi:phosphoglycolate phosphatase